jgi:hypothetical protein
MRTDVLEDRKCVHIKLKKEVHLALRTKLFKYNISMQELFDEFARLVANDSSKGQSVINIIAARKLNEAITGVKKEKRNTTMSELDSETLYNMINAPQEENT